MKEWGRSTPKVGSGIGFGLCAGVCDRGVGVKTGPLRATPQGCGLDADTGRAMLELAESGKVGWMSFLDCGSGQGGGRVSPGSSDDAGRALTDRGRLPVIHSSEPPRVRWRLVTGVRRPGWSGRLARTGSRTQSVADSHRLREAVDCCTIPPTRRWRSRLRSYYAMALAV
jgi:hypothetical protein